MPRKKQDEVEETTAAEESTEASVASEAAPAKEDDPVEVAEQSVSVDKEADKPVAKPSKVKKSASKPAKAKSKDSAPVSDSDKKASKRAERIGIVASDKMMKTVTVNVDRRVKHPVYRKYVKKRKKFMAHDDLGAKIGDKVKIVETRPTSARKRWRVVEILHKAEL